MSVVEPSAFVNNNSNINNNSPVIPKIEQSVIPNTVEENTSEIEQPKSNSTNTSNKTSEEKKDGVNVLGVLAGAAGALGAAGVAAGVYMKSKEKEEEEEKNKEENKKVVYPQETQVVKPEVGTAN